MPSSDDGSDTGSDATLTPEQADALSDTMAATPAPDRGAVTLPASIQTTISELEIGDVIGRGGMGEVRSATDRRIGRSVAIKRMHGTPSQSATERFLREAKIQGRLDHPAIVPVHELGVDDSGRPYFTMKRLSGTTLAEVMQRGDATQRELLRVLVDVCQAIQFAHERGVVHRDLKPANIMLGGYGEVYVLDWGLARVIGDREVGAPHDIASLDDEQGATQAGAVLGTPGYMSPEQVRGEPIDTPADVYALGAILYEILTGRPLHGRGTAALASTLEAIVPPVERAPERDIAPELDSACVAALAAVAGDRITAKQLADDIQRYLDGDRDLGQRRALAVEQLAIARAAVDSGQPSRRAEAMQAAGRALALDPESEAAALIGQLVVEPPRELPDALVAKLEARTTEDSKRQGQLAVRVLLVYAAIAPFLLWIGISDWTLFGITMATNLVVIVPPYLLSRGHRQAVWFGLVFNIAFLGLLSRFFGSFVFIPGIVAATATTFSILPTLLYHRAAVVATFVIAYLLPIALEATGVLRSTWSVAGHHMSFGSAVLDLSPTATATFLIVGNLALVALTPIIVQHIARAQHTAQRQLAIQAWHLEQLLPGRT